MILLLALISHAAKKWKTNDEASFGLPGDDLASPFISAAFQPHERSRRRRGAAAAAAGRLLSLRKDNTTARLWRLWDAVFCRDFTRSGRVPGFTSRGFNYLIVGEIESRRFQNSPLPRAGSEAKGARVDNDSSHLIKVQNGCGRVAGPGWQ